MDKKARRDFILYLAFLLFGVILWAVIPSLVPGKPGLQVDSRLFPRFISILFIVIGGACAASTLISALWKGRRTKTGPEGEHLAEGKSEDFAGTEQAQSQSIQSEGETRRQGEPGAALRVVGMAAIIVVYALLIKPIGFMPATFLAVTGVLLLERVRKIAYYAAVYVACIVLYLIFHYLLYVQL